MKKKKTRKSYTGRGHIIYKYPVPRSLYKYIWSLIKDLPLPGDPEKKSKLRKKYHRFLAHVFVSMRHQTTIQDDFKERKGFVPIFGRLIDQEFGRELDVIFLRDSKIIKIKGHDTARGKSREFKLREKIFKEALRIESEDTLKAWKRLCDGKKYTGRELVNLMTGRRMPSSSRSEHLKKGDKGKRDTNTDKLISKSIRSFKACPFNPKYTYEWIKRLKVKFEREEARLDKIRKKHGEKHPKYLDREREYWRAKGKYKGDLQSMGTILNQIPRKISTRSVKNGDPLYEYLAAYKIQRSGRISEIHGGFQNASRFFKQSLFRDMKGMKTNYDLKNSQASILLQEMEACKVECTWLEAYLEDPDSKKKYAEKIGISTDTWKDCFYAMVFGANATSKQGAVFKCLVGFFNGDEKKANKAHRRFIRYVGPLIKATEKWRNYIYFTEKGPYDYNHKGTKFWKNACEMRFKIYGIIYKEGKPVLIDRLHKEIRNPAGVNKCKRQLAAFILQGREACFIHNLTILCSQNGIPVYKNEHDGLITGKRIPKKLINDAAKRSGLKNPQLDRKPICGREKRQEMRDYVRN